MDAVPDSDFLTEQEKEDAKRETNVEFIKAYNARSFSYPKSMAVKSAKDIQAFAEDKLVAKSFTEMRCELPGAPRSTFLMVFSPDGTKVASTHGNHNIYVSDVRTGKNIKTLMGHPRTPWCIAFHPTSNQIVASGCLGGQVRIWDLSGGSEVWSSDNSTVIASLTFHPEDRLLVIATYNQLHFWDWSKPEPFATVSTATTKEKVRYVAFDPLGHKLITGISNNTTPQSRWERAQRCSPSPSGILATRHYHNTNASSPAHTSPPTQQPPPTIIVNSQQSAQPFSNIPPYNGRSQRARLTSRILAHYRAFPPRSGPDAHLYQTMFSSPTPSSSMDSIQQANSTNQSNSEEFSDSRLDVFGERLTSSSSSVFSPAVVPTNLPSADLRCSYGSRRAPTPTPAGNTSGWMVRGNRAGVRVDSPLMQDATTSVNTQQSLANESSIMNPLATSRREPLSSVPDRERRISACYRNLVREYEQLVHRYLQIYRPPVMIDRGTDPMDLDSQQQQSVTPSTSHARIVNNPAEIQPVSSNQPTDMRAVCEFTTDPSVLSPLRNHEVEAARRNSVDYRDDNRRVSLARRQTNLTDEELDNESSCRGVPTQTSTLNYDDGASTSAELPREGTTEKSDEDAANNNTGETSSNNTISVMLKNVKQALTSLRCNLDENINSSTVAVDKNPVIKTYLRLNNHNSQNDASTTSNQTTEEQQPAAENSQMMNDNINLEASSSADITSVDAITTNDNTNQDEVNDLITNLTIISSMAVQLKSVAERLTLHKDNEEKNKTNTENAADDGAVAGTSQPTANLTEPSESVAENPSETINVAADIKLAKKMVDKIVQIMNTFSTTNNQPSTSNENASRKRPYSNLVKSKSNRKPILVDSSDSSNSSETEESPTKRPCLNRSNAEAEAPANPLDNTTNESINTSSDEDNSNSTEQQLNEEQASTTTAVDNTSDTTSISMYNNVAADDIASTSDFAERRPWNYNRELEQLVTDLLHDNNDSNNAPDEDSSAVPLAPDSQHTLCSVCGDSLGTCTANECRNNESEAARRADAPSERRRRFFCHRLSAFHPTRVQTRLRNQRIRYSLASLPSARSNYLLPLQDPALDEVINFSQRSSENETPEANQPAMRTQYFSRSVEDSPSFSARLRQLFRSPVNDEQTSETNESPANSRVRHQTFEPPIPTYHPFDPPPELDTINPEHIGIGNMYSNIVQELETSLSDIRNIRSQRRLGETSDMLSNFSERLESIMTQSHAILRNLSTSIDSMPSVDQNGNDSSAGAQQRISTRGNTSTWSAANRDGDLSSSAVNGNRNPAANPHAVNADHSYPRPTHNMSPLMASLHLTVSHIWRQARLLRTQMDSIERIDRAMLELAQLRVMRQMFADLSRYFSAGALNVDSGQDTTSRHHRASNAPDQNSTADDATDTRNSSTDTTSTANSDNTTVNSMREMMAGTRISDNTDNLQTADQTESQISDQQSSSSAASTSQLIRGATGSGLTSMGRARKVYPCVLVMHPRHNRRYPNGGVTTMPIRRGLSRARYLGSRRSVFRQMSSQIIDVAAPGRGRNYVNLLNPDTFPSLSHRLEHYLIEHGRYICRRQRRPIPTTSSATTTNACSASTSAERLLTIRLNNCRLRMHRLLGGRTQYATNANTGPQSLVTRDGAGRFNARHTLCVMLDTLSRFMEVYGTGLVGISGSFRTYLREVIDLSRLLSEVLLLEIVDAIPPPTGMMLDPERENLSQRIDDMCSRMILTRLSSQSQPLTRSLRLMRLNVRFFSHAIHQNQLLEERFATNDHPSTIRSNTPPPLQTNSAAENSAVADLPQISHLGGGVRRLIQDREILAQYAQVRQREIQARIDDFAAQEGPEARVEEQTQRDRLARMENFVAHVGQARMELQRRREQRQQLASPPVNLLRTPSNMSDLLYQRLEQDRGAGPDTDLRSLYHRLRSEQEVRYPHQSAMNTNQPLPATNQSTSPPSSSGSPSPPLFSSGISAATTENQRFLDSLEPTPNNQQAAARPTTSAFISPLRRSQQHRRLYLRSAYDHLSLEDVLRHNVEHLNRDREPTNLTQRQDGMEGENNRSSSAERLYPMYFRNNPMWAVPEVQVNNVPISSTVRDPDYSSPVHRVSINRNPHARAPPIFSRPRFLHPLYAWPGLNPYPFPEGGGGGGAPPDLLDDNPTARAGDQQVYESDIIAAVTPNHRIQVWEFNRVGDSNGIIPNITNALKNIVVNECKIHNDASVDIASDGSVLVTLLPSNSYLNITNRLGIYSLEWETLGQCLYITTFDQNAVSVSLSPLSRHLVVGLASRRVSIMPSEQWTLARIFLLDGRRMAFGRLSLMKEIEQSRDTNFVMSVNCIRWLPTSGQGLVFATNTGQLRILN